MRASFLALALAACTPDIAPGTYFCGPEQLCPEDLVCNPADNICTVAAQVDPVFKCGVIEHPDEKPGDDTPETGLQMTGFECVSGVRELKACLFDDDPGDWFQLDVPDNCTSVEIKTRVTFPLAFEPIAMQLSIDGGAPAAVETPCENTAVNAGQDARCFTQVVSNGAHLSIGFIHAGVANCDGACAHNRYTASVQLTTP